MIFFEKVKDGRVGNLVGWGMRGDVYMYRFQLGTSTYYERQNDSYLHENTHRTQNMPQVAESSSVFANTINMLLVDAFKPWVHKQTLPKVLPVRRLPHAARLQHLARWWLPRCLFTYHFSRLEKDTVFRVS